MAGRRTALAASLVLLACDPPAATSGGSPDPDFFTVAIGAASETWSDGDGSGATTDASDNLTGGVTVTLHVPGDAASERFFFIQTDSFPVLPADLTARFTYQIGGVAWTNAAAPVHLEDLHGFPVEHLTGSFAGVVLTGPGPSTMTVSGSFHATVLHL